MVRSGFYTPILVRQYMSIFYLYLILGSSVSSGVLNDLIFLSTEEIWWKFPFNGFVGTCVETNIPWSRGPAVYFVCYNSLLRALIDSITAIYSASIIVSHSSDLPHYFVVNDYVCAAQYI